MTVAASQPSKRPKFRLSSLPVCARKAVYEAIDAPARERSDRERRILFRGRELEDSYARMLAAEHDVKVVRHGDPGWRQARIVRQYRVPWPLGIGHADIYLRDTRSFVEVLSSAHADTGRRRTKLMQAVGYREHAKDVASGPVALVILDPTDFSEGRVVVSPDSTLYEELRLEMEERVRQVLAWRDEGTLPERICRKPVDAIGRFCLHASHCFDGWEPAPLEQPEDVAAVEDAARRWLDLKRQESHFNDLAKPLYNERKEVEAQLADLLEEGTWQAGGFEVTRTHVVRNSFQLARAELDSRLPDDLLAEFTKTSEHDRFTVTATGTSGTSADEFGEVPF